MDGPSLKAVWPSVFLERTGIRQLLARCRGIEPRSRQQLVLWVVIALGIALRLVQYQPSRSLWHDEAALGANIIQRSFAELLQPLDFHQGAPIGFLMAEKIAALTLGNTDWGLRLIPVLCGIVCLPVFYRVARLYVSVDAALVALTLFAIGRGPVYYSAELKQYSSDVLITLLLWWYAGKVFVKDDRCTWWSMLGWGLLGAAALWFSHAAVLVLAGTGACFGITCVVERKWTKFAGFTAAGCLWLASFAVCHFLFLGQLSDDDYLQSFWKSSFMPLPPRSPADLYWFPQTLLAALETPGGFLAQKVSLAGVAALVFLIGCVALVSNRRALSALLAPVAFTLLASGFHKYPFADRLILFLVPALFIVLAAGLETIWTRTRAAFPVLGAAIVGLLFACPIMAATGKLLEPERSDQIKPMLRYLQDHRQAGDIVYVYTSAWPAFVFYAQDHGLLAQGNVIRGCAGGDWSNYVNDLERLRGRGRVWVLLCHHGNVERLFRCELARLGKRLETRESPGAAVNLYDFGSTRDF
jgi:hypothetical protein